MEKANENQKAMLWVQLTLKDLLDNGRDRQEAINEVLIMCAQIFSAEALGYAEWSLGIKFVMTMPN
jgi:hypothetical protein